MTLTGPGGTGKTRLSAEVAAASLDTFPDGVFFVPLATISDPDLFLPTVAVTLGIREGARAIRDGLLEYVWDRAILLVLDNFEQLIDAAPAVGELLTLAPRLKVMVTSRQALSISGEQEFPVAPLALPSGEPAPLEALQAFDSVALFVERARLVRPGFELTTANSQAVVEICARLDGLPLAMELAAARVRLFEPNQVLQRLDQRLSFLAGGRDLPERQRTLRGAIGWSHELLDENEQILFRRMSIFAGGCTLEAVEAVCAPEHLGLDSVEGVSSLHDKSLLQRDETAKGELRVTMLETIREYARELLEAAGEAPEMRRRHAEYFADLAERASRQLRGPTQQEWLDGLDRELDNVRAAIAWAVESQEMRLGTRVAASLSRFWVFRNHAMEGRRHLEQLLTLSTSRVSAADRAAALGAAADVAGWQGDYVNSPRLAEEALTIYRDLGDNLEMARQLSTIGYATVIADPSAALGLFRECIQAYRQAGAPAEMGEALVGMALPELQFRKVEEATRHLEEGKALFEQAGDDTMALIPAGLLGICARLEGDLDVAQQRYVDVLMQAQRTGAQVALSLPLQALADLALLEGDAVRAAVLDAAQAQIAERLGGTPSFSAHAHPGRRRASACGARRRAIPSRRCARPFHAAR